jgi:hypothetical protein
MRIAVVALTTAAALLPANSAQAFSSFYAVVNANGATVRGSGVDSTQLTAATGRYNVRFTRVVKNCSFVATVTSASGGTATVVPHATIGAMLTVYTFTAGGTAANRPFNVMVSCAP